VDQQHSPFTGEDLFVHERVIIAPFAGRFRPIEYGEPDVPAASENVSAGEAIGFLDLPGETKPVHSPFGGKLMGLLAHAGERVREGQPLAWLRVA
jgi:biotin carboxyl carrier protein